MTTQTTTQPQKFYLTKEGLKKVQKEYDKLLEFRSLKMKGEVPSILHSEDVNPDYLTFQEDMNLLESRIAECENILKNVELIQTPKEEKNMVWLGATVTLEEVPDGTINEYTLLGTLEANPAEGKISSESPVGRSLLGKRIGEEVVISSPIRVVYKVKKIIY